MTDIIYPKTLVSSAARNVNDLNENLTEIADVVNGELDESNLSIAILKLATGSTKKVNFGAGSTVFSAQNFKTVTITHGLGATPTIAIACNATTVDATLYASTGNYTSTTFDLTLTGRDSTTSYSETISYVWLAIG